MSTTTTTTTSILSHHPTTNNLKRVTIYPSNPIIHMQTSSSSAGKVNTHALGSKLVCSHLKSSLTPMQTSASFTDKAITHDLVSNPVTRKPLRPMTKIQVSSSPTNNPTTLNQKPTTKTSQETIFFDGGAHYGDLVANLILGFTLLWLPLTLAAVSRAFFLRYRFTNLRVTVISGFTGQDRSDFSYKVIKDVQVVPRFIGEWGDIVITLKDGTVVDLRSVPKFREIAKYCLSMTENNPGVVREIGSKGF